MPELPEVETIRLGLQKYLMGHKVTGVEVRLGKIIKQGNVRDLVGCKFKEVRRFGKALVLDLDCGLSIAVHIKLTGQLIYTSTTGSKGSTSSTSKRMAWDKIGGELPNKWTHVIFKLKSHSPQGDSRIAKGKSEDAHLYYNDIRQFGWIKIVESSKLKDQSFFKELGPEPFKDLTLEKFREILSKSGTKIKVLLMDQKKIGGVGNIYANDALLLARIDPRRAAKSLSPREQSKLYDAILEVLKRGLKYGGATEINFVNALGQEGGYQKYFLAYGQDGKPCPNKCGGTIKKIRIGGRGTYYCPSCQK